MVGVESKGNEKLYTRDYLPSDFYWTLIEQIDANGVKVKLNNTNLHRSSASELSNVIEYVNGVPVVWEDNSKEEVNKNDIDENNRLDGTLTLDDDGAVKKALSSDEVKKLLDEHER